MATLYDTYKSKGKSLPGVGDRFADPDFAAAAAKAGVASEGYVGSAEQNTAISQHLGAPSTIVTSTEPRQNLVKNTDAFTQAIGSLQAPKQKESDTMSALIKKGQGEIDAELNTYVSQLDDIAKRSSAATQNILRGIGADYSARRAEETDSNSRYMRGLQLLGIQGGEAGATPLLHAGTLRSAEIAGHKELARIDGEERKLIAEAEQAQLDNDFKLFNEKMTAYKEARREKNQVISDLYSQALNRKKLEAADIEMVSSYAQGLYDAYETLDESERAAYIEEIANQMGVSAIAVVSALSSEKERREDRAIDNKKKTSSGKAADENTYTDQELRKLRQAGIDPNNTTAADNYLYNGGVRPVKLTMTEDLAKKLEKKDVTSDDIIRVQEYLNEGYTFDQIMEQFWPDMPDDVYNIFNEGIQ